MKFLLLFRYVIEFFLFKLIFFLLSCFPKKISSYFSQEMTFIKDDPENILSDKLNFEVTNKNGVIEKFSNISFNLSKDKQTYVNWKSENLSKDNHTIIIHGKHYHEETQATFSHTKKTPCVIIRDMKEAKVLSKKIKNKIQNIIKS